MGEPTAAPPRRRAVAAIALALALFPFVASAAERIRDDWRPVSDDAVIAHLAHDVFSRDTPLLGMPSTLGDTAGDEETHHFGPMVFWALAVPDLVTSSQPSGLVVAAFVVNSLAVLVVLVFARRRGGDGLAVLALVLLFLVSRSLGRDFLTSIWNPNIALLPFAAFVVLAWAAADGDALALPFGALAASFVVQAHIVFSPLVALLSVWAVGGFVWGWRRAEADDPARACGRRSLVASALLVAVCWSTAIYEQLTRDPGNIRAVITSAGGSETPSFSLQRALAAVTRAVIPPPFWMQRQPESGDYFALFHPLRWYEILLGALVVVALGAAGWWSHLRNPTLFRLVVTAAIALVGAVVTVDRLPIEFAAPNPYRARLLWVVGMLTWLALVAVVVAAAGPRIRLPSWPVVSGTTLVVLAGASAVVAATPTAEFALFPKWSGAVASLSDQTREEIDPDRPYLLQIGGAEAFGMVGAGVMWDLQRRGIDVRVAPSDPYLGDVHGAEGGEAVLVVTSGLEPREPRAGLVEVAYFDASSRSDRLELERLDEEVTDAMRTRAPRLTDSGEAVLRDAPDSVDAPMLRRIASGGDLDETVRDVMFLRVGAQDFVDTTDADLERIAKLLRLRDRVGDARYAVFVDERAL